MKILNFKTRFSSEGKERIFSHKITENGFFPRPKYLKSRRKPKISLPNENTGKKISAGFQLKLQFVIKEARVCDVYIKHLLGCVT
jgi:hypothetical protein